MAGLGREPFVRCQLKTPNPLRLEISVRRGQIGLGVADVEALVIVWGLWVRRGDDEVKVLGLKLVVDADTALSAIFS